jgi:hypothetical protein
LLVKPIDLHAYTPEEARTHFRAIKTATLSQEEKKLDLQVQLSDSAHETFVSTPGYFQNLTQKIIDNLEICLENVHIRFEDSTSFPSTCFSMGVTLGSFVITTTDSNWNEKFVSDVTSVDKHLYKLGKISNLGVYWCISAEPWEHKSFREWMKTMKAYVYNKSSSTTHGHQKVKSGSGSGTVIDDYSTLFATSSYLLEPPNMLRAKVIHHQGSSTNTPVPKFHVTLESISMSLHLDKLQYQQAMHLATVMKENDRHLTMLQYRPVEKPSKQDMQHAYKEHAYKQGDVQKKIHHNHNREWWRYALMLVVNKEKILENKVAQLQTLKLFVLPSFLPSCLYA